MNWLYPNFLRRIDHYLKINYAHVWRTRIHDFGWFSLILGNVAAAALGILVVGRNNVFSEETVLTMHGSIAVLLGFVGLFWAMRLLRFQIKFSNFKTMLTTWVIYVLCVASLGMNLATFTSSVAYRTAYLYPDKTLQADYDYLGSHISYGTRYSEVSSFQNGNSCHSCLKEEYRTEEFMSLMSRHDFQFGAKDRVYRSHIDDIRDRLNILKEAKAFVWQPILGKNFNNHNKKSFYHEILQINWGMGMLMLIFLPTLLFLVSAFGLRNVLISGFCTALIAGLSLVVVEMLGGLRYYGEEERMLTVYTLIAFSLMLVLYMGRHRLQSWNYIAGIFMLMLGVVFFATFITMMDHYNMARYMLPVAAFVLSVSLLTSLIAAWVIARHNDQPVL